METETFNIKHWVCIHSLKFQCISSTEISELWYLLKAEVLICSIFTTSSDTQNKWFKNKLWDQKLNNLTKISFQIYNVSRWLFAYYNFSHHSEL